MRPNPGYSAAFWASLVDRPACDVPGCTRPPLSRGLCKRHHAAWWRKYFLPQFHPAIWSRR